MSLARLTTLFIAILGLSLTFLAVLKNGGSVSFLLLVGVGAAIGAALLLARFGFGEAFRSLLLQGNVGAFRVHALMCALASALFLPLLAYPSFFGIQSAGAFTPVGVGYVVGALLFGVGMQLGGGCASGTLYKLGGGNMRLLVTVIGLIIGSTLGAWHMGFWWKLPYYEVITFHSLFGWEKGFALHIVLLLGLAWLLGRREKSAIPRPLLWGGLALAVLNALVLYLSAQPWGEAPAFALWGSKILLSYGVDVEFWDYWVRPAFGNALEKSMWLDSVTIVDFAIVFGAMLAASLSNGFTFLWQFSALEWSIALIGGIFMGYGARLSNGCNIGAYFSGVASGSLSAYVWLAFALLGSWLVVRFTTLFRSDGA